MKTPGSSAPSEKAPAAATPGILPGVPGRLGMIALRAGFGQDEANHGTARFRVDNDGVVWVPQEAVAHLTSRGGFAVARTVATSSTAAPGRVPGDLMPSARATGGQEAGLVKLH